MAFENDRTHPFSTFVVVLALCGVFACALLGCNGGGGSDKDGMDTPGNDSTTDTDNDSTTTDTDNDSTTTDTDNDSTTTDTEPDGTGCEPGDTRCMGDTAVQICNQAGTGWTEFPCTNGCGDVGGADYCFLTAEVEPNDTAEQSQEVVVSFEGYGEISSPDDVDWYKFTLDADATVTVDTYPVSLFGADVQATEVWLISQINCTSCEGTRFFCGATYDFDNRHCHIQGREHGGGDDYCYVPGERLPAGTYWAVIGGYYDPPDFPGVGYYGIIIRTD